MAEHRIVKSYRVLLIAIAIVAALFVVALLGNAEAGTARRRASCESVQRIYDAQLAYTQFLAHEFHATPARTAAALADLRLVVGPRPAC